MTQKQSTVRHAMGLDPAGSGLRCLVPRIRMCTNKEAKDGERIAVTDEYVNCSKCKAALERRAIAPKVFGQRVVTAPKGTKP